MDQFDHYRYNYFLSSDNVILFGEKELHLPDQMVHEEHLYLPDGIHLTFGEGPSPITSKDSWIIGSLSETDFTTIPDPGTWKRRWYDEWHASCLAMNGNLSGIMGGTDDLWTATQSAPAAIALMGEYHPTDGIYDQPCLFSSEIRSSDPTSGAYAGFLGGMMEDTTGHVQAIYIDPSQGAGVLQGRFSGSFQPETENWYGAGTLFPTQMETSISIPLDMMDPNLDYGVMGAWLGGDFGTADSKLDIDMGWGHTLSLRDHDGWGIYQLKFGYDSFFSNPLRATVWTGRLGGRGEFGSFQDTTGNPRPDMGIWLTDPFTGRLDGDLLSASYRGRFLSATKYGEISGDLIGTPDTALQSWQGVASGHWRKTYDLLFNGMLEGEHRRTVEETYGHWDDGTGGSYYDYGYESGIDAGWSFHYDAPSDTTTHVAYHPDGTTFQWTESVTGVTFTEGTYSGSIYDNVRNGPGGVIVEPDPDPHYYLGAHNWHDGHLGGLEDLWNPGGWADVNVGARFRLIGEYDGQPHPGTTPLAVFTMDLGSFNPYDGSPTIWDQATDLQNGGYFAYGAGRSLTDHTVEADILGIYVDPSGNAGFLKGGLTGNLDSRSEMWEGQGGLIPVALPGVTGYDAAQLSPEGMLEETYIENPVSPVLTEDVHLRQLSSRHARLWGQHWGIRSSIYGGTYNSFAGQEWHVGFYMDDGNLKREGYLVSSAETPETTGTWSNGLLSGKGAASWVHWNEAVTGVSGGAVKGTFDPTNFTWQAAAIWASMDTGKFMDMVRNGNTATLEGLNISCVEIGKADLMGSQSFSTGQMDLHMQDLTFFSYSTGAKPRIWATDQITGTYSGTPNPGLTIPLSGTNYNNAANLSADFHLEKWDPLYNQWGGNIENGIGQVGGHSISFRGGAAGNIDSATSSLSGTGSGTAQ
jgi:hypothetical protein